MTLADAQPNIGSAMPGKILIWRAELRARAVWTPCGTRIASTLLLEALTRMRPLVPAAVLLLLSSCDLPRDPENTLERVRGAKMRVGITASPPWM